MKSLRILNHFNLELKLQKKETSAQCTVNCSETIKMFELKTYIYLFSRYTLIMKVSNFLCGLVNRESKEVKDVSTTQQSPHSNTNSKEGTQLLQLKKLTLFK